MCTKCYNKLPAKGTRPRRAVVSAYMAHAKLACKTLCVFIFVFACFYLRSSSLTKVPLPVLVLDHTSNLCRRDHDTCEYGAFFFNSLGAKFSVFSLETTVISMEDQIYAILFKVHYFLSYYIVYGRSSMLCHPSLFL